jgi:NAD(P)-dependent dehydrogenase (short-subunit alcohol dehydrogenase family)
MKTQQAVVLITGASSGIGEAIAKKLSAEGYKVYGTSRRGAASGQYPFPMLALDVTNEASVAAAVEELLTREGRIDVLINNAGFGIAPAVAEESSIEQAKALFDTNFLGVLRMTHAVVPQMRRQRSGRIINMSSILGVVPMPYVALYVASKHAVEGYSESLDHELRTEGIRVSVIEPAYTKTQFEANNIEPDAKRDHYQALRKHLEKVVGEAMKTADEPSVVADVVLNAIRAAQPKRRYTAGKAAAQLQFMRRFAPTGFLDAGIRKSLQLDN